MPNIMLERSRNVKQYFFPRPLYFRHPRPYIYPVRIPIHRGGAKSVTIAAGFRCRDGIVLCADTEMTLGVAKFSESKFRHSSRMESHPAFVYAGEQAFSLMAIRQVTDAIRLAERNKTDIVTSVREEIVRIHETYASLPPAYPNQTPLCLSALLVLKGQHKRRALFSIYGPSVYPVESGNVCIGIGEYLGYYINAMTFDSSMSVNEGAYAAAYMLFCVKQGISGCGGDSQIMTLYDDGGWNIFPDSPLTSVPLEQLESDFKQVHRAIKQVLVGLGNFSISSTSYKESLARFNETLTAIRDRHSKQITALIEEEVERQAEEFQQQAEEASEGAAAFEPGDEEDQN